MVDCIVIRDLTAKPRGIAMPQEHKVTKLQMPDGNFQVVDTQPDGASTVTTYQPDGTPVVSTQFGSNHSHDEIVAGIERDGGSVIDSGDSDDDTDDAVKQTTGDGDDSDDDTDN